MASNEDQWLDPFLLLSQIFVDDGTVGDTLRHIAGVLRSAVPAEMAGVTVVAAGKVRSGGFTDACVSELDEAQYECGTGPCVEAIESSRPFRSDLPDDARRWPQYARCAGELGIRCSLSVPVTARGETTGACSLYARTPDAFGPAATSRAVALAGCAGVVIANVQAYWELRHLNENLNHAMRSRASIDYATGILMANGGRSPEDAFHILVRASQRENRKLRDIAAEIVERAAKRSPPDAARRR